MQPLTRCEKVFLPVFQFLVDSPLKEVIVLVAAVVSLFLYPPIACALFATWGASLLGRLIIHLLPTSKVIKKIKEWALSFFLKKRYFTYLPLIPIALLGILSPLASAIAGVAFGLFQSPDSYFLMQEKRQAREEARIAKITKSPL